MEMRNAKALRDTPGQHPSAPQAGQQIAGKLPREVLGFDASINPDGLVAPTPPSPPQGPVKD